MCSWIVIIEKSLCVMTDGDLWCCGEKTAGRKSDGMRIKAVESVLRGHRTSPHRVLALEQVYVTFLSSEEKRIQPGSEALHHQEILCLLWTGFSRFWTCKQFARCARAAVCGFGREEPEHATYKRLLEASLCVREGQRRRDRDSDGKRDRWRRRERERQWWRERQIEAKREREAETVMERETGRAIETEAERERKNCLYISPELKWEFREMLL